MLETLKAALAAREERLEIGGIKLVVRELESAADVEALKDQVDAQYKMLVLCVFAEDGTAAFALDEIPELKKAGKATLNRLFAAVNRVNGFAAEAEAKNFEAAPSGG